MVSAYSLLAVLACSMLASATPTPQNEATNGQVLRQATRSEIISRATRVKSAKRAGTSAVPITCGSGQEFVLGYSGSGTGQDGFYGVVDIQPDRPGSSSYTMQGTASTPETATVFTLDSECDLVTSASERVANAYSTDFSGKVYFDTDGNYGGDWPVLTCSVTTSTSELTCTSGSNVKYLFAVCPTVNPALYISGSPIAGNCEGVTLTASLV